MVLDSFRAHSSGWLERIPDKDEVPGSNPGGPTNWMKNENLHVGGSFWTRSQALISPSRLAKSPRRAVWEDGRLPPSSWKSLHLRSFVDYAWLGQQDMSCITTERLRSSPAEAVSLAGIEGAGLVKVEKLDSGSGHPLAARVLGWVRMWFAVRN